MEEREERKGGGREGERKGKREGGTRTGCLYLLFYKLFPLLVSPLELLSQYLQASFFLVPKKKKGSVTMSSREVNQLASGQG